MADPTPISFARGAPSLDIVAVDELKAAAEAAFTQDPGGTCMYGTAIGYVPLREWIAEKHGVPAEQVVVTNGSMQADAFLFQEGVAAGDQVIVEAPTYDRTLLNLRSLGAEVIAIPLESDGIDVGALEKALENGARPKLAHIIPNFHNPGGCTLSLEKRHKLIELAAKYGFLIFEDDPYVDIRFAGEPLPRMIELEGGPENVLYACSFSKTVCPGIRVGYLIGPADRIARIVKIATNTYISPNMVAESIVNQFCRSGGMDGAVATVKEALRERRDVLCSELREQLPEAQFVEPEGGYFLWIDMPAGTDGQALFDAAAERGLQFVKGTDFFLEGGENSLRIAYSGVNAEQIREGVGRLAEAYRSL
jgi:DNA-binding transcriptional MocR family regulator